jgi:hypothetical protein
MSGLAAPHGNNQCTYRVLAYNCFVINDLAAITHALCVFSAYLWFFKGLSRKNSVFGAQNMLFRVFRAF